ncbi:glycerophosphodiester phosphodiesterase [Mumia sp. zg.B53]|uniref:glycerophosphodiester phosphodiesterase n=1 Tax=unclassified Mumia TaxID=2621872 RepID=UPI001C6E05DF|nr:MULTISPECIES: glycerophosphodiester phosphodiesterase [unclassified Mumia]MBW9210828.1 glycerophosphodiester phosphodiesterase [Mumia sp. zg.B21]MBW9215393.1 glycerophosphodiester phosphodiesterase [Mumia sp. zg.B53]
MRTRRTTILLGIAASLVAPAIVVAGGPAAAGTPGTATDRPDRVAGAFHHTARLPVVIAHRGASGYRPEHTIAAYGLAIRQGADVIEPDLVITKDKVLVARHENEIGGTTDVADHPRFNARRTTKTIDGRPVTGWFTEDFTLAELKTLRAKERLPLVRPGNTVYDGRFTVPTFDEVLDLARRESLRRGRPIGVAPETKHPTYFRSIGKNLEDPLVRTLDRRGLNHRRSPVTVQSFETANLQALSRRLRVPLAQNVSASGSPYDHVASGDPTTYADMVTPKGLRALSRYADILSAEKDVLIPRTADGALADPTTVVRDAHRSGLDVYAWTFRAENQFLPADFRRGTDPRARGNLRGELRTFYAAGVDGVFTDFPDVAVAARSRQGALPHR